jgi:Uma2 family endonuclease
MLTVEEAYLPLTLSIPGITDAQFQELCEQYEHFRLEYTSEGELLVMPPTDPETGIRNAEITSQLRNWARPLGVGGVTDSSAGFVLPTGARRSPDSAWISQARLRCKPTCPEFIIELMSPTDRRSKLHEKMLEWINAGAELGWLIDPRTRTVSIYRAGAPTPEVRNGITEIAGEGPVAGFVLDLRSIW